MSASSKARVAKRIAKKGKGKNTDTVGNAKAVTFNIKGDKMVAAIAQGVANETTTQARGLVDQLNKCWAAIRAEQMAVSVDHTTRYLNAVRDAIIDARKRDAGSNAIKPAEVTGTRVGDMNAQLHLHNWACRDALIATLKTFDGLTFENITDIARWMRGPHGNVSKANWKSNVDKAPSRALLRGVIAKRRKQKRTASARGKAKAITGMPLNNAVDGLGHVVKCLAAFDKKHRDLLGAGERKVIAQSLTGLRAMFTPLRTAVAAKAKADAKAAAAKAKGK